MKRTLIALVALLAMAPAIACMGMLVRSEMLIGGMACTYQLSDGSHVRVIYQGALYCPPCME
jgi:hypothetical protein